MNSSDFGCETKILTYDGVENHNIEGIFINSLDETIYWCLISSNIENEIHSEIKKIFDTTQTIIINDDVEIINTDFGDLNNLKKIYIGSNLKTINQNFIDKLKNLNQVEIIIHESNKNIVI